METASETKCDYCGDILSKETDYPHSYGVRLSTVDYKVGGSSMVYAVNMTPPLQESLDFCGVHCAGEYLIIEFGVQA